MLTSKFVRVLHLIITLYINSRNILFQRPENKNYREKGEGKEEEWGKYKGRKRVRILINCF